MGTMGTFLHGQPEIRSNPSRPAKTWGALRGGLVWAAVLCFAITACKAPVQRGSAEVRLYDLTGSKLLVCSMPQNGNSQKKGFMRTKAPNGEVFQGEWVLLTTAKSAVSPGTSGYQPSLPIIPSEPTAAMGSVWGWASGLGIDFGNFPKTYWSFLLYGDGGTIIDGFFIITPSDQGSGITGFLRSTFSGHSSAGSDSLTGAAKDNRGHRYKVMG